jgi:hypothetical protein
MQLLQLNDHVAFYAHRGEQLEQCTLISFRTSYLQNIQAFLKDKGRHLNSQIPKAKEKKEDDTEKAACTI